MLPANLAQEGWTPTGDWKWSKEIGEREVVLRVSTESAQSERKEWEVFLETNGYVYHSLLPPSSFSEAVEEAKRMYRECEALVQDRPKG